MKILLIYYTGTYNTRFTSLRLKEHFKKLNHEVDLVEITDKTKVINPTNYDLIGLGYPIYGFNAPLPFNKYLRKVKFKKNQQYFIYKNSGETMALNNASSRVPKRIMKRKKTQLVGEYHLVMPYNIHFPFPTNFIKEALNHDELIYEVMVHNLLNHEKVEIKANFLYNFVSFLVSIQKLGGPFNSFFYRVDQEKCIKCGKCIKTCPHNNIYFKNNKIKFHHHCQMCMRCSFFCPVGAIKIGMLEHWRVTNYYNLDELLAQKEPFTPYITDETLGFYKCFIKYFKNVEISYQDLFQNNGL